MKHKGNISYTQLQRNMEIIRLFKEMKRTRLYPNWKEICKKIADTGVSRHYMSEERAYVILRRYLNDGYIPMCSPYKHHMYDSFITRCMEIISSGIEPNPRNIMRMAIEEPASCIGISPNRIQFILRKEGMK